ncbi:MAG: LysM peptidoglycan-binding domain-containing protein [Myxococcaceae bacterium]|nr:MAG: LysM peptidoglycan-binding domain-containing protein [Myxococcaceae bacterium]
MRVPFLLLCLAVTAARAQAPGGGSSEVEGTEVKQPAPQQPRTPGPGEVQTAPPEGPSQVHTVEKGDTLWDLSSKYLGTPWYWPKVWSYNPQIANPHWIYPGNQVRFYPGNGEETPARAEQVVGDEDELQAGQAIEGDDEVQMVRLPVEAKTREIVLKDGFVTPNEVEAAGTLVGSYAESEMLSPPDVVYLEFKDRSAVQVGASYLVYRTVGKVHHPRTGKFLGYQTQVLGTVKVNRTSEPKVRATIEKAFDEIGRGARIGPARERLFETVAPVTNAVSLQNLTVVAQLETSLTMAGEQVRVLVDAGSAQGVQVGNVFTVIRQVDPILSSVGVDPSANQDTSLPVEEVGRCMAVDVREAVTTCLLLRSFREVVAGDRVELRAAGPQTAVITR